MELSLLGKNAFALLFMAAVVHGIYLSILLFVKSHKEKELRLLGFMMWPASFLLATYLFYVTDIIRSAPHLLGVFTPLLYLLAPALYFFVKTSIDPTFRFRLYHALHLLPMLYVLWEWAPVYSWPAAEKLEVIERIYQSGRPTLVELILGNRFMGHVGAYVIAAWFLLRKKKSAPSAHIAMPRMLWLQRFIRAFGMIVLVSVVIQLLFWILNWPGVVMELVLLLVFATALHVLGYVVLGRDQVLPGWVQSKKYATSPLTPEQIADFEERIASYLEDQRPWLDSQFTIADLAVGLAMPRHHISQVLNEGMHVSFYDLINGHRVDEVKRRLLAGEANQFSLQGIAEACGFGSRSSFYRAFRKKTGLTPAAFARKLTENTETGHS